MSTFLLDIEKEVDPIKTEKTHLSNSKKEIISLLRWKGAKGTRMGDEFY